MPHTTHMHAVLMGHIHKSCHIADLPHPIPLMEISFFSFFFSFVFPKVLRLDARFIKVLPALNYSRLTQLDRLEVSTANWHDTVKTLSCMSRLRALRVQLQQGTCAYKHVQRLVCACVCMRVCVCASVWACACVACVFACMACVWSVCVCVRVCVSMRARVLRFFFKVHACICSCAHFAYVLIIWNA